MAHPNSASENTSATRAIANGFLFIVELLASAEQNCALTQQGFVSKIEKRHALCFRVAGAALPVAKPATLLNLDNQ